MSLMAVHSVLPDSVVPASVVSRKFDYAAAGSGSRWYGSGSRYMEALSHRRSGYGYGLSGLAGLGDTSSCGDITTVDASGNIVDACGNVVGNIDTTPVYTTTDPASGVTYASPNQSQLAAALANAGLDLATLAIIQPGTSQAGGSITRQNPGYPVAPIATSTQTGLNVGAHVSTGAGLALGSAAAIGLGIVALAIVFGGRRH